MEKMISKRDVILCRGIWYVVTLLSLFGLSISINLLLPPEDSSSSSSSHRFLRDGAVSVTTFYAVMLLRHVFFAEPLDPSACYKEFTKRIDQLPQILFSELAIYAVFVGPLCYSGMVKKVSFVLHMSLFTTSFLMGGIGLIQLSDKFRMEMRHALFTLFFVLLFSLFGIFEAWYALVYNDVSWFIFLLYGLICFGIVWYNDLPEDLDSPLPT